MSSGGRPHSQNAFLTAVFFVSLFVVLQEAIHALKGQEDKIRCVLNKADSIGKSALMRVYGALMWSLGKVMDTPEVLRVYVGSFWSQPLREVGFPKPNN